MRSHYVNRHSLQRALREKLDAESHSGWINIKFYGSATTHIRISRGDFVALCADRMRPRVL
jgi:CTP-dependent riboflavin kinase